MFLGCIKKVFVILLFVQLIGCVNVGGLADSLTDAVLNQRDPATVRDGAPAYLILIDSLINSTPDDASLLLAGSKLYGAYASAFVTDAERSKIMSSKALDYARQAFCQKQTKLCAASDGSLDEYSAELAKFKSKEQVPYLHGFATAWVGWIEAHADDWQAIADLPKVEASIKHVLALDEAYDDGSTHLYAGVLATLRPAVLGGQPEQGKMHFVRALELSENKNLMAGVLYAKHYARLVFDKELHDQLLQDVIAADATQQGFTLINTLAKEQAQELLSTSDDYF